MSDMMFMLLYFALGLMTCGAFVVYNIKHNDELFGFSDEKYWDFPIGVGCILLLLMVFWPASIIFLIFYALGRFVVNITKKYKK